MKIINTVVRKRSLPNYTYLGCSMTKNRSPWCFRLCQPNSNGFGKCGRPAPHFYQGRIQLGIIEFEKQKNKNQGKNFNII
jgi:hypothetical protein